MKALDLHPAMSALLRHYAQTGEIPSRRGLAQLWGYQSRGWADRVAARLVASGFLVKRDNGRLTPGPRFDIVRHDGIEPATLPSPETHSADQAWATILLIIITAASLMRGSGEAGPVAETRVADLLLHTIIAQAGDDTTITADRLRCFPREVEQRLLKRLEAMVAEGTAERAVEGDVTLFRFTNERWRQKLAFEGHERALAAVERLGAHDRATLERVLGFIAREASDTPIGTISGSRM